MVDATQLGIVAAATGGLVVAAGVALTVADRRTSSPAAYLRATTQRANRPVKPDDDEFTRRLAEPFRRRVLEPNMQRLAATAALFTPADHRSRIQAKLSGAGLDGTRRPEEIMAAEAVGGVLGLIAGLAVMSTGALSPFLSVLVAVVLTVIGLVTPMVWVSHKYDERQSAIRADLPDTLDLMAISVEAGVGLEGAMAVVTERMQTPLAAELARTLQEMGLGLTRRDALTNLKHRSPVPELTNFVQALIQADILGMPIGRVLKVQANEMRAKRRQWSRERAAKLPVKILFPLIACIFPAVLVVIVGPAFSQIGSALG